MNEQFLNWAKENEKNILKKGISLEILDFKKAIKEKRLTNPCQTIYYNSKNKIGSVSVWKSGCMDIEIIDCNTEEIEYYKHFDDENNIDFNNRLKVFFSKMN